LLAATLFEGNPDRNHELWNIISIQRKRLLSHKNNIRISLKLNNTTVQLKLVERGNIDNSNTHMHDRSLS
jgi:hypothetical protein